VNHQEFVDPETLGPQPVEPEGGTGEYQNRQPGGFAAVQRGTAGERFELPDVRDLVMRRMIYQGTRME
jgi:hypothetical protein